MGINLSSTFSLVLQKLMLTFSALMGTGTFFLTVYFYHRIPDVRWGLSLKAVEVHVRY